MTTAPQLRPRWYVPIFLAVGIVAVLGFWIYASADSGKQVPAFGGTYTEAATGTPQRVNPLYAGLNPVDADLSALVFSGLTRLSPEGVVLPDLAERWDISEDGLDYTFYLRKGLLWHDSEDLDADDAVFTWSVLSSEEFDGDPELGTFWQTVSAERVDDLTVRYTLEEPFAPFLAQTTIGLIPEHLLAGEAVDTLARSSFNQEPTGSGPYRLSEVTAREATLRANESYHLGPPYIETLHFNYYGSETLSLQAVAAGEAEAVYLTGPAGLESIEQLSGDHTINELTSNSYTMLYLNWNAIGLDDAVVRRAITFAINREAMVAETISGRGVLSDSAITPGTWPWTNAFAPKAYDPARAMALLEDAGWALGSSGVREQGGQELSFRLVTNNDATRSALASAIASDLQQVGIRVSFSTSGSASLYEQVLQPHRFDMALFGFAPGLDPDPFAAWHSSQAEGGANIASINDSAIDETLAQGRLSNDSDRRAELYIRFQQLFYELEPSVVLFYPTNLYVQPERLRGTEPGVIFSSASRFHNVWQWFVETRRVQD